MENEDRQRGIRDGGAPSVCDVVREDRERRLKGYCDAVTQSLNEYRDQCDREPHYFTSKEYKKEAIHFLIQFIKDSPNANLDGVENHPDYHKYCSAFGDDTWGRFRTSILGRSELSQILYELKTISSANIKRFYAADGHLPRLIEDEHNVPARHMDTHAPQDLDQHYVNLVLTDQKGGARPIDIAEIFNADTPNQPPPHKRHVLITGTAGMGKSTLMRYITYRWGKDQLYQDRFDYVFRVQLKLASPDNWRQNYSNNARDNLIGCFVDYSLKQDFGAYSGLGPDRLVEIFTHRAHTVLLLLDGYDEVSTLYG